MAERYLVVPDVGTWVGFPPKGAQVAVTIFDGTVVFDARVVKRLPRRASWFGWKDQSKRTWL
jgi:hypothetical protein